MLFLIPYGFGNKANSKVNSNSGKPAERIWIAFKANDLFNNFDSVILNIIKKLSEYTEINVLIGQNSKLLYSEYFIKSGIDTSKINCIHIAPLTYWIRDTGPALVKNENQNSICVDFNYTHYENIAFDSASMQVKELEGIDRKLASVMNIPVLKSKLILEGGAYEDNGNGTLILTNDLVLGRNPEFTRKQIEVELKRTLGAQTFIWLKQGLAQDPQGPAYLGNYTWATGTGGHTDHFVRFANDSTILLYWETDSLLVNPVVQLNRERMSENFAILQNAVDHRERRFSVVKVPSPGIFYKSKVVNEDLVSGLAEIQSGMKVDSIKTIACASYLNYLSADSLIILPEYGTPQDEEAEQIFRKIFPNREIFRINPLELNFAGGGIHCLTWDP